MDMTKGPGSDAVGPDRKPERECHRDPVAWVTLKPRDGLGRPGRGKPDKEAHVDDVTQAPDVIEDEDEDLDEEDFENQLLLRAKWSLDGAATMEEAAAKARELADRIDEWRREGYALTQPIYDDYGYAEKR